MKTHNYYTEMFGIPTQPRDYLSAPYQMSKVKSTLHQLIRDWSDEVGDSEIIHSRVKKNENYVIHLFSSVLNTIFLSFVMRMVLSLLRISIILYLLL